VPLSELFVQPSVPFLRCLELSLRLVGQSELFGLLEPRCFPLFERWRQNFGPPSVRPLLTLELN